MKPKNWRDAIWGAFDKEDRLEWYLLCFGWAVLILFLVVEFL